MRASRAPDSRESRASHGTETEAGSRVIAALNAAVSRFLVEVRLYVEGSALPPDLSASTAGTTGFFSSRGLGEGQPSNMRAPSQCGWCGIFLVRN